MRFALLLLIVPLPAASAAEPLMDRQLDAAFRATIPRVENESLQKILDSAVIYTDREIPKAYQKWDGQAQGVHSVAFNISGDPSEPFGNANREFPWSGPFGTHRCKDVGTYRLLYLPPRDGGGDWPVVWWREDGYRWIFPKDAILGEVLYFTNSKLVFEMRLRQRGLDEWHANVFRPYPTAADLEAAIAKLRPQETAVLAQLRRSPSRRELRLHDRQPRREVFRVSRQVDEMPALDAQLTAQLLDKPVFKSCFGETWKSFGGDPVVATTSTSSIFPANYDAGFVDVDDQSCMKCHETTNRSVDEFDRNRDWYGRVRGSDGILSFHPFAKSSISDNGASREVKMNQELLQRGIVEHYDPAKHPESVYKTIKGLR